MSYRLVLTTLATLAMAAPPAIAAPTMRAAAAKPVKAKPVRYCIDVVTTGSRRARRECLTRKQWLAVGIDPVALVVRGVKKG